MAGPWEDYASAAPAAGPWTEYATQPDQPSTLDKIKQGAGNLAAGAVRGAGSIGATLLPSVLALGDAVPMIGMPAKLAGKAAEKYLDIPNPIDRWRGYSSDTQMSDAILKDAGIKPKTKDELRRAEMDSSLQSMGAEPDSWMYKGGKLAGEIAGTAGAGGLLANGARAAGATRALAGLEPIVNGVARGLETGGFRVGELAGTGAGALARIGTGAAVGGASAGLVNPDDAGTGALIGGALPGATQLAGKAGAAIRNSVTGGGVTPEVAALAKRAQELGINIPADRLVNSRPMNAAAGSLSYLPFSGRAATEDAMNSQLNRALSGTFGQDSSNVTQALRKAESALGSKFDDVLKNNTVRVDQQFMQDLAESANRASRELGTDGASIIGKQVDDILMKAGTGEIDGQAAYNIKRTLDRIGQRNSPEAFYANDMKKALMGALNRSIGPEKAAEFAKTRQQYGSMLDLQRLAKNGAEGEVSVARLANMRDINNPQMQELADIAAQFVKPREGAHGAAQRVYGAGGLLTGGFFAGGPVGSAIAAAGGMAAGRAGNGLLNSQMARNYLLNGAVASEPEALGLLTQGAYRSLPLLSAQ
jgi:hypothetical protein